MGLELAYGLGALVLALGLAWGIFQSRSRNRANDEVTDRATREEYDHPETYDHRSEDLKREVHPSS